MTVAFTNKSDGTLMEFNLTIGIIPTEYSTLEYFTQPGKGALGLMPQLINNDIGLEFQFIYQFCTTFNLNAESFLLIST